MYTTISRLFCKFNRFQLIIYLLATCIAISIIYTLSFVGWYDKPTQFNPLKYHYLQLNKEFKDNHLLFLGMISAPANYERRRLLRNTWLQTRSLQNRRTNGKAGGYVFYVGGEFENDTLREMLREEQRIYKDIVLLPIEDVYRNLTLKTRLAFEHAASHYEFAFFGKVDDDVLLCLDSIEYFLEKFEPNISLYFGIMYEAVPIRDPENKWYVSVEEYPDDIYPMYSVGAYYFLSRDLVVYLGNERPRPTLFLEDVTVGISLKKRGLPIVRASWEPPYGLSVASTKGKECLEGDGLKVFGSHGKEMWEEWQVCCDKQNFPDVWVRVDNFNSTK
eukprot:TRINITY_DN8771_c0_g1_i1.p1 TRINITY_DN8771_c0_g1~~TRINITY_DN8771_c0_g1_i1.p1  ORF type:complete len:332 (+),score=22.15 TRINITY_DN8771_c0_g1_i1:116-1111(+)